MVELLATVAAALIGAAVLLTRKAKLNRWATTAIWLGELTVVVVSFALLGWPGLVLALGVLVAALLATSVRLAMQVESALVAATGRGKLDLPRTELREFHRSLHQSDRIFAHISRVQSAELIRVLSECGRNATDIRAMAPWIIKLWTIAGFHTAKERENFTRRFDRCMRLWGLSSNESERMADTLLASSKQSAATLDEMLDGLIAFKEPASG